MTAPRVAILGAGRMGRGIAVAFARASQSVVLIDVKDRTAEASGLLAADVFGEIGAHADALSEAGDLGADRDAILGKVDLVGRCDRKEALSSADILFEAVPETRQAKSEALASLELESQPDLVVASTSSTFVASDFARMVPVPERALNAHWLNPAYLMPLVEVSCHGATSADTKRRLLSVLTNIGKRPVLCSDAPGYIVPRLQTLVMNEAARMLEEGVATAEDIDVAIRYGFGIRYAAMGVVEFIDFGGGDILHYASRYLAEALGDPRYESPAIVGRNMDEQRLGLKTGRGFYEWAEVDVPSYRKALLSRLLTLVELADNPDRILPRPPKTT